MTVPHILPPRPLELVATSNVRWGPQLLVDWTMVLLGCVVSVVLLAVSVLPIASNRQLYEHGAPGRIVELQQSVPPAGALIKTYEIKVAYEDAKGLPRSGRTKLSRFQELDLKRKVELRHDRADSTRFVLSDSTDVLPALAVSIIPFVFLASLTFVGLLALRRRYRHPDPTRLCATESEELLVELLELVPRSDGQPGFMVTYRPAEGPPTARRDHEIETTPLIVRDGSKRRLVLLRSSLGPGAEMIVRADLFPFVVSERDGERIAEIALPVGGA